MAKWRKDSNPEEVTRRLDSIKKGTGIGNISFDGFEMSELILVLDGMIELAPGIPDVERRKLLNTSAFECGAGGEISAVTFLKSCNKQEGTYLGKPLTDFRLLTGISIAAMDQLTSLRLGSVTITFDPRMKIAQKHRTQLHREVGFSLGFDLPSQYTNVSVAVKARSPFEAAERALEGIDLLRSTWNLSLNRGKSWRISTGRPRPVNEVLLFPFHTVHTVDGRLATDSWWYDPSYTGPVTVLRDAETIRNFIKFSKKIRARIRLSAYSEDLESALVRYVRALDSPDLHDAFLRLWGVLEFLMDSTLDSYKVTVRRAAFMFADRDYSIQVLTNLMNHRNRFVHAGKDSGQIESLVYLLKRYVDQLLIFHIGNSFQFASRTETAHFMDLPTSRIRIDERIETLRKARKFIVTP